MELRDLIGNNLVSLLNFNNTSIIDSCNVPWQTDGGGVVCNEDQKFSDNVFKSTGSSKPLYTTTSKVHLNRGNQPFTVGFWQHVITRYDYGDGMHASSIFIMDYYELNMSGGPLWLYDGGQPWKSGWHYDYNLGNDLYKWNHFCLTRTDSGFRYYINGNLICSRGNMWTNTNDYEVVIGNRAVSYFDNIFVSDIGLEVSSFEITKPVGSIDSLLLFNDNNVYGRVDNK